jgi:hypothetical protein
MKKTNHPLTSKKCEALFTLQFGNATNPVTVADAMRAAADWQLEQVLEWLEECPNYLSEQLKKSMRP